MAGIDMKQSEQAPSVRLILLMMYILTTVASCQAQPNDTLHIHQHIVNETKNAYELHLGIDNADLIDVKYTITFALEKCCPVFMFGYCGECRGYRTYCSMKFSDAEAMFFPFFIDMNIEIKKPGCQFFTDGNMYVCEGTRTLAAAVPRPWDLGITYICGKTKSLNLTIDMELTYYTHGKRECMPLPQGTCKETVPYNQMSFPNLLGQTDVNNTANLFALLMLMKESHNCYQHFVMFICYTLYPGCQQGHMTYPCKQMCEDFRSACGEEFYHVELCSAAFPDTGDHVKCFYKPITCPKLKTPKFGSVISEGYSVFNMSRYACDRGYELHGNATRHCMYTGLWNGSEPVCWPSQSSDPMVPVIITLVFILVVILVGVGWCKREKILRLLQCTRSPYLEVM